MSLSIGLDIGGTKIAGAIFNLTNGEEILRLVEPTPANYEMLLKTCVSLVERLEQTRGPSSYIGVGVPGSVDRDQGVVFFAANTPCLVGQELKGDLVDRLHRPVYIANDADCAALSEATDGAGLGKKVVFGLIMGTGVGGGLVVNGRLIQGANGLFGEFGHTPLPYRSEADGPEVLCDCGQKGCIDKSISGPGLQRLYHYQTGEKLEASMIAERARAGDMKATRALAQFMDTIAKAMVSVIHILDPDIIVVSGGLSSLPQMYDVVPGCWRKYTLRKDLNTVFVPARHGVMTGLRGAAWLGKV